MFIIYVCIKLQTPSSYGSLVIAVKMKAKYRIFSVSMLFYV